MILRKGNITREVNLKESDLKMWLSNGWSTEFKPSEKLKEIVAEKPIEYLELIKVQDVTKSIEDIRAEYESVTGKKISKKYAKNSEWLLEKINEAK